MTGQDFRWAYRTGGELSEQASGMVIDHSGFIYIVGNFEGTIDADPGDDVFNLTASGKQDIFIQKLDTDGNLLWAKSIGGEKGDYGKGIAMDDNDNIYITGSFRGTVDFDPGDNTFFLTSEGYSDAFVQKLDSDGNLIWVKNMGGKADDSGTSIAVSLGNVYLLGNFSDTANFDPVTGRINLTGTGAGSNDIFIQKMSTDGDFIWVKKLTASNTSSGSNNAKCYSITTDAAGNLLIVGGIMGSIQNINQTTITSTGLADIFIQKLDGNGNLLWIKKIGGSRYDYGYDIAIDDFGNIFTTGNFEGTIDFNPGSGVYNMSSGEYGSNMFILKLDADGSFLWANNMGGNHNNNVSGYSIVVSNASVYVSGIFSGSVEVLTDTGASGFTSAGEFDTFILKSDAGGETDIARHYPPKVKFYPNPNSGLFYVELPKDIQYAQIEIVDFMGRTVKRQRLTQVKNEVSLSRFSSGVYYIKMVFDTGDVIDGKMMIHR